jgi:hypothetical protein
MFQSERDDVGGILQLARNPEFALDVHASNPTAPLSVQPVLFRAGGHTKMTGGQPAGRRSPAEGCRKMPYRVGSMGVPFDWQTRSAP